MSRISAKLILVGRSVMIDMIAPIAVGVNPATAVCWRGRICWRVFRATARHVARRE
jgi:hypothetical protein